MRAARHPSEAPDYLITRVLAYCLEYTEGISFSNGLSTPDEPAIAVRDLTGVMQAWIDIGAPSPERLHRASKATPRVAVYTHKDAAQFVTRLRGERIHRQRLAHGGDGGVAQQRRQPVGVRVELGVRAGGLQSQWHRRSALRLGAPARDRHPSHSSARP